MAAPAKVCRDYDGIQNFRFSGRANDVEFDTPFKSWMDGLGLS